MRPIWGHREFMHTDFHFTLKENNSHLTTTPLICPFICHVTFVCFHTTGSLGWRHYLFLPCMVTNMLPILKINSRNTGSLSCNLSPGNLYLIQESQFFSWHYLCYLGRDCANTFHVCEKSPCCSESDFTYPFHTDVTVFFSSVALHTEPFPRDPLWARGKMWAIVSWVNVNKTYVTFFLFIYLYFFNNRCCNFVITFQTPASYFPWGLKKFANFYYSVSHPVH